MRIQILVLIALATFATSASAADFYQHGDGVTLADISQCLDEIGLEDGRHFRKKKGDEAIIELNRAAIESDFREYQSEIADCWKKKSKPSTSRSAGNRRSQDRE